MAAVLQLGAAAAGPFLHLDALSPQVATAAEAPGGADPGAPLPQHDERSCYLCQSHGAAGILPTSPVLPFEAVARLDEPRAPSHPGATPARTSWHARAPPIA